MTLDRANQILRDYQRELDQEAGNRQASGIKRAINLLSFPPRERIKLAKYIAGQLGGLSLRTV